MLKVASSRGDTIIEVLVSTAVLGIVLGISYNVANRSLRTGLAASQRREAVAVAQGQIELLKKAHRNDASSAYQFQAGAFSTLFQDSSSTFCAASGNNATSNPVILKFATTDSRCTISNYSISITYGTGQAKANTYAITVSWPSLNGSANQTLTMFYQL